MTRRLLLAAVGLGLWIGPALGQTDTARSFDPDRLLADLRALAHDSTAGRRAGSPEAAEAARFLAATLAAAGAEPVGGAFLHPFPLDGGEGVNVLARIEGTGGRGELIVLGAHYDHLGTRDGVVYNGADDNASGTAALLAIARTLGRAPLEHTVVLAAFDAEETGLRGARRFVEEGPVPLGRVGLMVNLDMVARTGGVLWAAGAHHTPALRPVLERVAARAPLELRLGHDRPGAPEGDDWTDASDHAPFHGRGVPFVYFGVEDHADYHRPTDDVENVDPQAYVAAVRTVLMALEALDRALPLARGS